MGYRLVYSKTEKRHKDGHFIANNEIAPEDREPKDPSYRFEGETSIIEVRYESVGGRITPKSGSFHYTSDQSNWPKGSAANKIEFEADVLEFEYLDAPLSDDALKAEWPEAAIVYDYVKGTKQNPFLRVFEEGELRDMNPPKVGEKAPIFEVSDFEGKRVSLDQFRGEYVFVHLWATWCSACVHEIPAIERDWNSFKDKNVVFIGVSLDEDTEKLKRYVEEKKLSHLQLVDSGGWSAKIMRQYGAILLPTCLLIDPDGVLIANKSGYMMGVRKDLLNVLGVKPGTP
ncbi:TlpA family protein disulfide reductase [Candidatus Sumerlaeota bacterium]|nr:TlpA family protein disulfide reductase [Candidatus Sumerlaeota bacterium]